MESTNRDEEILALMTLASGLAGYIDGLNQALEEVRQRLLEIGVTASKVQAIEELAKKYAQLFEQIDEIVKKGVERASKETPYVA
jgi:beta-phosphoglucomutase-like phosphatase (HAD superfamily)